MSPDTKILLWILLIVAVVIGGPLISIWALNTLFPVLAIPYTLETWFAAMALAGVFKTSITKKD
jgi:hypothetical protein